MNTFDARTAKTLEPGKHITFISYPGLRLVASASLRTWIYRFKSPIDARMRQILLGHWPAVSFPAAIVAWEGFRQQRDAGVDPVLSRKHVKLSARQVVEAEQIRQAETAYTVAALCADYLSGHVDRNRAKKGVTEIRRMFNTMLGDIEAVPAVSVSRSMAFDLINHYAALSPVQAGKLRCELGAAWDFAIDSGRLPETAVNWWRLILRGKIRSKGKIIGGENIGTTKRVLTESEVGELILWLPNFPLAVADALTLYLWTGTRGAEICAMMGSEIVDERGQIWWVIPKSKTKNARHANANDHRVPLFGRALTVVIRRKKLYGDGYLFPARHGKPHIDQSVITVQVYCNQPYCKTRPGIKRPRLPVSHWAPHDLRRTARTFLAKIGCPDSVGEAILGHILPGVVGTYNRHHYDAERVEWLGRLSDFLDSLTVS